jgi:TolB protein
MNGRFHLRKRFVISCSLLAAVLAAPLNAQQGQAPSRENQELWLELNKPSAKKLPIALPPSIAPAGPLIENQIRLPFSDTLKSDLDYCGAFSIVEPALYPKGYRDATQPESADRWAATGAEVLVDTLLEISGDRVSAEARVYDLKSHKLVFGKRYSGGSTFVPRIAHAVADDIVKYFTGKPGLFMTAIGFCSDRDGGRGLREIYEMDYDGRNPRRLTQSRSLSMNPSWSSDGHMIVFTSYAKMFPRLFSMDRVGGNRKEIPTGVELNASPSYSPDGRRLVFAGSVAGNPEIFTVNSDGTGLKRLTTSHAVNSTPRWSPVGNQILYTSSLSGTPQLYLMDPDGANSRRVTLAGDWNDEGAWSPDGSKIAYACRNGGDFQICVTNLATSQTLQLTSEGSNGHPSWSPDGTKLAYDCRRGGSTQIYTMDINGQNRVAITDKGNNSQPSWSPN